MRHFIISSYQFNPGFFKPNITATILLKALTNLPHTDFTLCKCLIDAYHFKEAPLLSITEIADLLETCRFQKVWVSIEIIFLKCVIGIKEICTER